ncbi:MAG: HAMP domain-containing protein [Sulfuritalea sp.]|nr:HAMP domain-containing protein [Sulfuritalea sp.]
MAKTSIFQPGSWSITSKLAAAFVLAALLPMVISGWYNLTGSIASVENNETSNLEQLASTTAGRIDQLIRDTRHLVSYFAWSEEAILVAGNSSARNRVRAQDKMNRILASNEDIELMMVLTEKGVVAASTKPEYIGRKLAFRDYFKQAVAGREYISDMEVGTASRKAGVYFSGAVRSPIGNVAGVVVLKMKGQAITAIATAQGNEREIFLVDANGIVIHHPDPRLLYRSLTPLSAELQKQFADERRFGTERVESLGLTDLARVMSGARLPGHAEYISPLSKAPRVVGFAPAENHDWIVAVSETRESFSRPLITLYEKALYSAGIVGLLATVTAIIFARMLIRPIRDLARSAEAARHGDYAQAKVAFQSRDEIGRLAETFNTMIDGVVARERERDIFGRIVSPEVREKLLSGELALGGEKRRVTVLFSDLRGFATMSEKMSPRDVVEMLNEYLTAMATAIKPWGGYINNFVGDAIIVVFGAPVGRAEIEWCAVASAFAMRDSLKILNQRRTELGEARLESGIGISTGPVVVGQVGSLERFLYTVIGDAVNVAARLETLTKEFDENPILCNGATYEAIHHRDDVLAEDLGFHQLKGRNESVQVFSLRRGTDRSQS